MDVIEQSWESDPFAIWKPAGHTPAIEERWFEAPRRTSRPPPRLSSIPAAPIGDACADDWFR